MCGYVLRPVVQEFRRSVTLTVSGEIQQRIVLGRLLEHLTQMEHSARAARAIIQNAMAEIETNRTERLPVAREMIIAVLQASGNEGLSRSEIMAGVDRDYGVPITANTATTTLLRMQRAGLASRFGLLWVLKQEAINT
jgi:hypothetical protein